MAQGRQSEGVGVGIRRRGRTDDSAPAMSAGELLTHSHGVLRIAAQRHISGSCTTTDRERSSGGSTPHMERGRCVVWLVCVCTGAAESGVSYPGDGQGASTA